MSIQDGLSRLFHKFFILTQLRTGIIIGGLIIIVLIFFLLLFIKKLQAKKMAVGCFLSCFVFLIFASAFITRIPTWHFVETWKARSYNYSIIPFYSYYQIYQGKKYLIMDKFFNTLMLMPVGMLLPTLHKKVTAKQLFFISLIISGTIELGQLVVKCGLFETDDIIHNVLGCLFGYLIYKAIREFVLDIKK